MHYTSHWRLSFILALVVHFFLWSGATFLLPLLVPEPPVIAEGTEILLEDIPLAEETKTAEEPDTEPVRLTVMRAEDFLLQMQQLLPRL